MSCSKKIGAACRKWKDVQGKEFSVCVTCYELQYMSKGSATSRKESRENDSAWQSRSGFDVLSAGTGDKMTRVESQRQSSLYSPIGFISNVQIEAAEWLDDLCWPLRLSSTDCLLHKCAGYQHFVEFIVSYELNKWWIRSRWWGATKFVCKAPSKAN